MLISKELNEAINGQIGREFGASMQYLNIATYFDSRSLSRLASFFYKQAEEEHEHAMKFFKYVVETGGHVAIPPVDAPKSPSNQPRRPSN
jgi:bacterioferritin B